MYPIDRHGEYQVLHAFIEVRPCHRGGYYCTQQEVRHYFDGTHRVIGGRVMYSHDASPEITSMMQIFSSAKFALECATESPK
jgi:hypothetical protein